MLAFNALGLVLVASLAEVYLRWDGMEPYVRTYPGELPDRPASWAAPNSELGWTMNAETRQEHLNGEGFRHVEDFATLGPSAEKKRILVLGDSFIFGVHLQEDETIPVYLQEGLGEDFEVFNLGIPGWGIDQMYLAYELYKDNIDPDVIVLAFIDDDIKRVLEGFRRWERLNKPTLTLEGDRLVTRNSAPSSKPIWKSWAEASVVTSYALREVYLMTEARPVVGQVFCQLAADAGRRDARLVIVRLPTPDNDAPQKLIRRALNGFEATATDCGALYLDGAPEIRRKTGWHATYYGHDGHFNAQGAQWVAEFIESRAFRELNLQDEVSEGQAEN